MNEMRCTVDDKNADGVGRCQCSFVTASGGTCRTFGPRPTFAEAFPYLAVPHPPTTDRPAAEAVGESEEHDG